MKGTILNILAILLGLAMIAFGADKFLHFIPMPAFTSEQKEIFGHLGAITWLMPLIGIGEILSGLALAVPRTRALGAFMMYPISLGILCHAWFLDRSALGMGAGIFVILMWIIWEYRGSYMGMVKK